MAEEEKEGELMVEETVVFVVAEERGECRTHGGRRPGRVTHRERERGVAQVRW